MYRSVLVALVAVLSACSAPAPLDFQSRPAGVYRTTFGPLALTPPGEDGYVTGLYKGDAGNDAQLSGRYAPGVLGFMEGIWWESGVEGPCEPDEDGDTYYGTFTFRFSDGGRSFDGTWSWCDGPEDNEWTGRYAKALPSRPIG